MRDDRIPLLLFVFTNTWDQDEPFYHPEMVIASNKARAMKIFKEHNSEYARFDIDKEDANKFTARYVGGIGGARFHIVSYPIKEGYIDD